ncbi:MAG: tetratricopeptide repeat protein [Lentisphaerae bacterium]|nr:tetratricopeptide repeat protein [Lentisphaerota bacterium]
MRKPLLRSLLVLGGPVILLLFLEGGLRLWGFGTAPHFFLTSFEDGVAYMSENPHVTRPYFGPRLERNPFPAHFPRQKPPGEFRVFVLGESAAMGDPIPEFGLSRQLDVLLTAALPQRRVRVINAAITAINSHVIRQVATECARLEPDAFVIYMGNNEVVGPYGPGTVFPGIGSRPALIHALTWWRGTRTGQLVERAMERLHPSRYREWEGMEMFLDRQVRADDPRLATTRRLFEANLDAMCRAGSDAGAAVVLCTVAVNLRDCAPLGSSPDPALSKADRARMQAGVEQALTLLPRDAARALTVIEEGLNLDPGLPDWHYLKGKALAALGGGAPSREAFIQARELDTLRFRADTAINDRIRRYAANSAMPLRLVDVERHLADQSPDGLCGESTFYDHVHLTFEGQYGVARDVAEALLPDLAAAPPLPSAAVCAAALGWTPWQAQAALMGMYGRRLLPPFANQVDRADVERRWMERLLAGQGALATNEPAPTVRMLTGALETRAADPVLWQLLGQAQMHLGEFPAAAEAFGEAACLLPQHVALQHMQSAALALAGRFDAAFRQRHAASPELADDVIWSLLAASAIAQGHTEIARALFERARLANPRNHDVLVNLAVSRASRGDTSAAIPLFESAVRHRPDDDIALANLGVALYRIGRKTEGLSALEGAAARHPHNAETRNSLAMMYLGQGDVDLARRHIRLALLDRPLAVDILQSAVLIEEAARDAEAQAEYLHRLIRLSPSTPAFQEHYGECLLRLGRYGEAESAYTAATGLAPESPSAWHGLGSARAYDGRQAAARAAFEKALTLDADFAPARFGLGQVLLQLGDGSAGLDELRRACTLVPTEWAWRRRLAWILATHPDAALRQPAEALDWAASLPAAGTDAWMRVDIQAAATAAGGDPKAAEKLLSTVTLADVPEAYRTAVQDRLTRYARGDSYVETAP